MIKKIVKKLYSKINHLLDKKRVYDFKPIFEKYFGKQPFSDDVFFLIKNVNILPQYRTYHSLVAKEAYIAKIARGQLWKRNNDKIRVVFVFQEASYWPSLKTLYDSLKKDEKFEVFVLAIPVLTIPDLQQLEIKPQNIQFLEDNNIEYIDARCANGELFDLYVLKPDYVFTQIHFDIQRVMEYKASVMRLYTKVCLIPHAFLLSSSDNKELYYQADYFRIFVPNEYHAEQLSSIIHRTDNIEITGYPRFDLYAEKLEDSPLWKISKRENHKIKRIIWSPHWWAYGHNKSLADGVLNLWEYFYNYAKTHNNIELVVKPHPNLFNGLTRSKYISQTKADSMISTINDLPNASVYTGGNYIDLFKTADLIVNNSISFLAEWLPSEKPMVFFDTERKFELNEMADRILNVYYHASSIVELNKIIEDILDKQNDELKMQRLTLIEKLDLKPANAAEKIKQSLIEHVNESY